MSLSAADQQRIIKQQEAWLDTTLGQQLDLSQFPSLQPAPVEREDKFQPREEPNPAKELRNFVSTPDAEAISRLAEERGGEFVEQLRDLKGSEVVREFTRRNPAYLPTDANYRQMVSTLSANLLGDPTIDADAAMSHMIDNGSWTVRNLEATYRALRAEGLLEVPEGTAKELTAGERLHVARLAQSGKAEAAIEAHLRFAVGDDIGAEILSDPSYRPACDRAVWDCWQLATPDFSHTPERQQFISRFVGQRPLTLHLLNAAWSACQTHESRLDRNTTLGLIEGQNIAPAPQLDDLTDEAVDSLYHGSLRQYARDARRSAGVLA